MKVGVIGAGAGGLISAKRLLDAGVDIDVFERSENVGGTWVYSTNFVDKHGLPKHSSIYQNLKTNLPKELMLFEGLDYDVQGVSFITAKEVLDYLQNFCKKFNLDSIIKFEHFVKKVSRKSNSWEIIVKDLKNDLETTYIYDAVFVCNGHFSNPYYRKIIGSASFPGSAIHSHYYKIPEPYKDKVVLITGIGPSAIDITFDIAPYSKLVYLSHHGPDDMKDKFPENVIHKPDVKHIDGSVIYFLDTTSAEVDAIIYCSGYKYDFPFLDDSCEIKIDNNYVYPLYKQFVSIPHSSMFFIGMPFRSFIFTLLELQARCSVNIATGEAQLPSKDEMEADTRQWEEALAAKGTPKRKYHSIGEYVKQYFRQLEKLGNVEPCPDILFEMYSVCSAIRKANLAGYRNKVLTIIDSKSFRCD